MSLLSGLLARRRLLNAADLGDRFVPHIVPRDDFSCEESWSEWQDLNLQPPRPERGVCYASFWTDRDLAEWDGKDHHWPAWARLDSGHRFDSRLASGPLDPIFGPNAPLYNVARWDGGMGVLRKVPEIPNPFAPGKIR